MPDQARESERPHVSWRAKIVLAILSVLVFMVAAEAALRLAGATPRFKNQFFPVNRDIDFTEVYKKDPDLFWRFREGNVIDSRRFSYIDYEINRDGFRGPRTPREKPADGLRIVALGNSCTFGWGVDYKQAWTSRLADILSRELQRPVQVINAGVPGYSSHQGRILLEKELLDYDPDLLLVMFGFNDHFAAGKGIPDHKQEAPADWILDLHNLVSPFKLYQFMRTVVLSLSESEEEVRLDDVGRVRRVPVDQFYQNLRSIAQTARSHDIEVIYLVPPVASLEDYFAGATSSAFHSMHAVYQKEVRRLGRRDRLPVIDLQESFDSYENLYDDARADPVHFNIRGHEVAARTIARALLGRESSP